MMTAPPGIAPIAAAAVVKKRKKIIRAFRDAGATSSETSKTLAEVGLSRSVLLEIQKLRGVLVEPSEGRYYLDEAREKVVNRFRKVLVACFAVLCTALVLLGWWLSTG